MCRSRLLSFLERLPLVLLAACAMTAGLQRADAAVSGCYNGTIGCNDGDTWTRTMPEFFWVKGVVTPRLIYWQTHLHPSQVIIRWGDGSADTNYTSANAHDNGGGDEHANKDDVSQQRIVTNDNQCYWTAADCVIQARHTFASAGRYYVCVTIQVTNTRRNPPATCSWMEIRDYAPGATFNIATIGDSAASGEGAPSSPTIWAAIIPGFGAIYDYPEWETRFGQPTDAHESFFSAPSWAAYLLQSPLAISPPQYLKLGVDFWDASFSGALTQRTERTNIDDGVRTTEGQAADLGGDGPLFDAVVVSAGANDIPLRQLIEYCMNRVNCTDYTRTTLAGSHVDHYTALPVVLDGLPQRFRNIDAALKQPGNRARKAQVYVMQYIGLESSLRCLPMNETNAAFVNQTISTLNAKIVEAAQELGWIVVRRNFSSTNPSGDNTDHGMCAGTLINPNRWVNTLHDSNVVQSSLGVSEWAQGFLHANQTGHMATGELLKNLMEPQAVAKAACAAMPLSNIQVTPGAIRFNFATRKYVQQITVRSTRTLETPGEIVLRLDGIDPSIKVTGSGGHCTANSATPDSSYFVLPRGLSPGQQDTFFMEFENPMNRSFRWTSTVLSANVFN